MLGVCQEINIQVYGYIEIKKTRKPLLDAAFSDFEETKHA